MDLKELYSSQKENIDFFFKNIDLNKTQKLLNLLINCKNNLIFTGVGKSAFIANKIAMTMLSSGTKAIFLPPLDALHGDIGIVTKDDVVLFFSKSGQTEELLEMITFVKKRNAKTIAVVCNENSRLAKLSDEFILLPLKKELCPYNLIPTTSTTLQLIYGDILTVALMENKRFSLNDYAINHPKGAIGKKIFLKVEDLMIKNLDLPICREDDLIKETLSTLSSKKCGCLLIVDKEKKLKGIFTDGDLRRLIEKESEKFLFKKMKEIMVKDPIVINKDELVFDAMKIMQKTKNITALPVLENSKVIGLLHMHDIVKMGITSL